MEQLTGLSPTLRRKKHQKSDAICGTLGAGLELKLTAMECGKTMAKIHL